MRKTGGLTLAWGGAHAKKNESSKGGGEKERGFKNGSFTFLCVRGGEGTGEPLV